MELRCQANTLHARLIDGRIEVKCRDRMCGYRPGLTILHYFSALSGELLDTKQFDDPSKFTNLVQKESTRCR